MSICDNCCKRSICNTLCPEAEAIVSQDYVTRTEITTTELGISVAFSNFKPWPEKREEIPKKVQIAHAIFSGKGCREICQMFNISSNTFYVYRHNIRKSFTRSL